MIGGDEHRQGVMPMGEEEEQKTGILTLVCRLVSGCLGNPSERMNFGNVLERGLLFERLILFTECHSCNSPWANKNFPN